MSRARHVQDGPDMFGADDPYAPRADDGARSAASSGRRLIVEADGGSRGNPGRAGYGALVRDADTGDVLDSEAGALGHATNNVAEYSGLIAGLEMARAVDAGASVEVRMDSKLVIEQMAGRWKIKHPDMRPLALRARDVLPPRVSWTWVPRERNKAADRLANEAMDGRPRRRAHGPVAEDPDSTEATTG